MTEEDSEDVEHVVTIVGERERVDDRVVLDYAQHDHHTNKASIQCARTMFSSRVPEWTGE